MDFKSIPQYRIFTYFLISFLFGVFISSLEILNYSLYWQVILLIIIFITGVIILFKFGQTGKILLICALGLHLGLIIFSYKDNRLNQQTLPFSETKEFTAIINSFPENKNDKQSFFAKTNDFGEEKIIYLKTERYPEYRYGDKIKINAKINKPENYSNFDWVNYLKRFSATGVTNNPKIELISHDNDNKIIRRLFLIKKNIEKIIDKNLPEPESSLAKGILVGTRESFSKNLIDKFNSVGITHIIALSGFNVTIIVVFVTALLIKYLKRKYAFLVSIILVILFVVMTGSSASVVRASIVSLLLSYGMTIGRRADKANLILVAASIMVLVNPFTLRFDLGFQLSFLAYLGLIYFSKPIFNLLSTRKLSIVPPTIRQIASETLSAQIVVLPLLLSTFGRISIIAPLSNILILPVIPLAMLLSFISIILSTASETIGKIFFLLAYLPLKYIILVANYLSKLPIASYEISENHKIILILGYSLFIFIAYFYIRKKWQKLLMK